MFKKLKEKILILERESIKNSVIMDLDSQEFKEKYPLHGEAIEILNSQLNIKTYNAYISNEEKVLKNGAQGIPSVKRMAISTYFLEKPLPIFACTYAHEGEHIKRGLKLGLLTSTILYGASDVAAKLSLVAGIGVNIITNGAYAQPAIATVLLANLSMGMFYYPRRSFYYHEEHKADLSGFNSTAVLPSVVAKSVGKENYSTALHPKLEDRDKYVLKHGNPNPDPRLLALFKMDEANRIQKVI